MFGLLLIGLSAFLLAAHWQLWRESVPHGHEDQRARDYLVRTARRRTVASSLVGIIGMALMAYETVPRTPLSITAYLFSLVLLTCWTLWLACLDLFASRRFQADQQLDQIAEHLRQAELESSQSDSDDR